MSEENKFDFNEQDSCIKTSKIVEDAKKLRRSILISAG